VCRVGSLALLTALRALPAIDATLCAEAVQLLHFRQREPSAALFAPGEADADEQPMAAWADEAQAHGGAARLGTAGGVVVPLALLRQTTPASSATPPAPDQAECLRRAERLLSASD
jgi:hypothetical protein